MLTKEQRHQLIEEFESRPTLASLAAKYGITRNAVAMILFRHRQNLKKPNGNLAVPIAAGGAINNGQEKA